jgi:hypothetical protein
VEHSEPRPAVEGTGRYREVSPDWMSASGIEPLVLGDPVVVWLKYHGLEHGLQPDSSPYEFLDFIGEKARQFESKWIEKMAAASDCARVCTDAREVRSLDKVRETFKLMWRGTPVLVQPALWWPSERIYGVPDLLVHTSWLQDHLPDLARAMDVEAGEDPESVSAERRPIAGGIAKNLGPIGRRGHYVVLDMKFTTAMDEAQLRSYAAQVRIYSYMLGHLQGFMPRRAYLVTRDRIFDPIPVEITSILGRPLDEDLAALRDQFVEIKVNGAKVVPWRDPIVASDISRRDARWHTAKKIIAREKTPGGDPGIVYRIGADAKRELARRGFATLDSLLQADPGVIPFEECPNLGPATARQIRAMLQANRTGLPAILSSPPVLPRKEFEFYVDFEYFSNVNVDFNRQWPTLEGCEMIFMIGVGRQREGAWAFRTFVAAAENHDRELEMAERFVEFLQRQTGGAYLDETRTALFHWTKAEVTQSARVSERHQLPDSHPFRRLPWHDLHREFLDAAIGLPGAWSYQLKDVTKALMKVCPDQYAALQWPGDLDQGLRAMVMGWKAYRGTFRAQARESPSPKFEEMAILTKYLESDCKALEGIVGWIRGCQT